ncbi:uncharacterized protein A4U43_C06F18250 [Asparagus officinalis]|uniref:Uncharacterized protein n=1 Tax=Asparagus officinalis TaxID=4686 RepID=A0A5P1EMU6_ASPOF|nr:uncharacterized protein A4U43_C06F18250 [Asparagus officinalis]
MLKWRAVLDTPPQVPVIPRNIELLNDLRLSYAGAKNYRPGIQMVSGLKAVLGVGFLHISSTAPRSPNKVLINLLTFLIAELINAMEERIRPEEGSGSSLAGSFSWRDDSPRPADGPVSLSRVMALAPPP